MPRSRGCYFLERLLLVAAIFLLSIVAVTVLRTRVDMSTVNLRSSDQKLRHLSFKFPSSPHWSPMKMYFEDSRIILKIQTTKFNEVSGGNETNLIVGRITPTTNPIQFAIFCGSVREAGIQQGKRSRVVVFSEGPTNSRLLDVASTYDVSVLEYNPADLQPSFVQKLHPASHLWILFQELFQEEERNILSAGVETVVMADVESVAFLRSNFIGFPSSSGKKVTIIGRDNGPSLLSVGEMRDSIQKCFAPSMWNLMNRMPYIPAGVLMSAEYTTMLKLSRLITKTLSGANDIGSKFPACDSEHSVEALINVMVHSGFPDNMFNVVAPSNVAIASFANGAPHATLDLSKSVSILEPSRAPVSAVMVLDYSRNKAVYAEFVNRFVDWKDKEVLAILEADKAPPPQTAVQVQPNVLQVQNQNFAPYKPMTTFNANNNMAILNSYVPSDSCNAYSTAGYVDLLRGQCDLLAVPDIFQMNACCAKCNDTPGCTSYVFTLTQCFLKSCDASMLRSLMSANKDLFSTPIDPALMSVIPMISGFKVK